MSSTNHEKSRGTMVPGLVGSTITSKMKTLLSLSFAIFSTFICFLHSLLPFLGPQSPPLISYAVATYRRKNRNCFTLCSFSRKPTRPSLTSNLRNCIKISWCRSMTFTIHHPGLGKGSASHEGQASSKEVNNTGVWL